MAGYGHYIARRAPDGITPDILFYASGPNARRIAPTVKQWRRNFSDFENWVRLSSLLSVLSYFESFVTTISTLALRSDPLLRFGQSRVVDGATWLKRTVRDDTTGLVVPLVKGEWPQRLSAFRDLFEIVPPILEANIQDLEQMRSLRNGVAHSFGRNATYFEDPTVDAGQSVRLSEERLQRWLSIIESCADAIDQQLLERHIGEFELIWRYHRWKDEPRDALDRRYIPSTAFSRFVNREYGFSPGRAFCKQLIAYYEAA